MGVNLLAAEEELAPTAFRNPVEEKTSERSVADATTASRAAGVSVPRSEAKGSAALPRKTRSQLNRVGGNAYVVPLFSGKFFRIQVIIY